MIAIESDVRDSAVLLWRHVDPRINGPYNSQNAVRALKMEQSVRETRLEMKQKEISNSGTWGAIATTSSGMIPQQNHSPVSGTANREHDTS